jgi:hypothetical protein
VPTAEVTIVNTLPPERPSTKPPPPPATPAQP